MTMVAPSVYAQGNPNMKVDEGALGFRIPNLADILTFAIRGFFVIAGLAALFYLLLGAFAWVTSSGEKENIKKAQDKISAAIIGLVVIVAVIALIYTFEAFVFAGSVCVGLYCPVTIPQLLEPV